MLGRLFSSKIHLSTTTYLICLGVLIAFTGCANVEYVAQKKKYNARGQYIGESPDDFLSTSLDVEVQDPERLGNLYVGQASGSNDINFEVRKETSTYTANAPIYNTDSTRTDFTVNVDTAQDVWAGLSFRWHFDMSK